MTTVIRMCDFAILTVLEAEKRAVLQRLDEVEYLQATELPFEAAWASLRTAPAGHPRPRGLVALIAGMGRVSAAIATTILLERWRPRYCILVGTAGGFASAGVRLGDVVVATEVVDHSIHKVLRDQTETRPITHHVDSHLMSTALRMAQATDHSSLDRAWSARQVHFGPMISGDRIIASETMVRHLVKNDPRLIGVEMEGSGVLTALEQQEPAPHFLMVRGVADLADEHKSDDWMESALQAAAAFSIDLLELNASALFAVAR
jgi:5'-methylthioadenosine/S-adenosylhomocysteine nucleosidase